MIAKATVLRLSHPPESIRTPSLFLLKALGIRSSGQGVCVPPLPPSFASPPGQSSPVPACLAIYNSPFYSSINNLLDTPNLKIISSKLLVGAEVI